MLAHLFEWNCRENGGIPSVSLVPLNNQKWFGRFSELNETESHKAFTSFISEVLLEIDERSSQ